MSTQVEYVKNLTCFKDLSAEDQNAIAKISDAVCYSPGYVLFREGEKAKKLYLIVKRAGRSNIQYRGSRSC